MYHIKEYFRMTFWEYQVRSQGQFRKVWNKKRRRTSKVGQSMTLEWYVLRTSDIDLLWHFDVGNVPNISDWCCKWYFQHLKFVISTRPHLKPYHKPMKYGIIEIISVRSIIVRNWLWITEAQRWNGVQQFYWEFLKSIWYWQDQTDPTKVNLT